MSLPKWVEDVREHSMTENMANYTPRLIQALSIAWAGLENCRAQDKSIGTIHGFAKDAMREISELGEAAGK